VLGVACAAEHVGVVEFGIALSSHSNVSLAVAFSGTACALLFFGRGTSIPVHPLDPRPLRPKQIRAAQTVLRARTILSSKSSKCAGWSSWWELLADGLIRRPSSTRCATCVIGNGTMPSACDRPSLG
jgi:hypothetical protein